MRRRGPVVLDLSERDTAVLCEVEKYRLLSSGQLQRLLFNAHHATPLASRRRCQAVLRRLVENELLERLPRRLGGHRAGSVGYIYRITSRGRRAIGDAKREEKRGGKRAVNRSARGEPTDRWADHTLACAEVAVCLIEAEQAGRVHSVVVTTEPQTWRSFVGRHAERQKLRPDLLIELVTTDRLERRWFVEIDRATEHLPTVLSKCQQYQAYWQAGSEPHPVFPRVLWSVPDSPRAQAINGLLARSNFEPDLFAVATAERTLFTLLGDLSNESTDTKGGET